MTERTRSERWADRQSGGSWVAERQDARRGGKRKRVRGPYRSSGTAAVITEGQREAFEEAAVRVEEVPLQEVKVQGERRELRRVEELAESIREVGLLNPITVTEDLRLVAGYHRLEAYRALGRETIPATIVSLAELDESLAELDENLVRSELTALERMVLVARRKKFYEAKYPETKRPKGGRRKRGNGEKISPLGFTADTARKAGVTRRSVQQEVRIATQLAPEAVRLLWGTSVAESKLELSRLAKLEPSRQREVAKEIGCRRAKTVKEAVRNLNRKSQLESIGAYLPPPGRYGVIVADPPWPYERGSEGGTHRGAVPYPVMSIEDICAQEIPADDDCVLFLWVTNAFMREAFVVLDAWGFESKTLLTWIKDRMGLGNYLRNQTEHAILAIKGKPEVHLTDQSTVLRAPVTGHSRKPDEFYSMVEELCPAVARLDLFAREHREGWVSAGPELPPPAEDAEPEAPHSGSGSQVESGEDVGRGSLDAAEGLGQGVLVPGVELDVVGGGGAGVESDRAADDEGHGLGLGLPHRLGGPLLRDVMKGLVGQLVDEDRELLRGRKPGGELDGPAGGRAEGGTEGV